MGFQFPAVMAPGRHWITATVAHAGTGAFVMDRRERLSSLMVQAGVPTIGIVSVPFEVRISRAEERIS